MQVAFIINISDKNTIYYFDDKHFFDYLIAILETLYLIGNCFTS